jgi:hypothetical protein
MTNPFMSMWLSAVNSAAGQARGFWTAEMQRQQAALVNAWTKQAIDFWSGAWIAQVAQKPSRRTPRKD